MGFLDITNTGNGFIGEIGDGWRINYSTTPTYVEDGAGSLGSLSFSARCDETTIFAIDNYLSVKHYLDEQTNRWLSTFDINLASVSTSGYFASFSGTSRLAELDVVRQPSPNPSGTYQRKMRFPRDVTYTANAVTYTVIANPTVYDIVTGQNYVYVLAQGSHGGEVLYQFGLGGDFMRVWAVYSDATDLANPQSRYVTYTGSELHVAQVAADRIKRFSVSTLAFLGQYGAAGTGNGQFNTISGLAYASNQVFALDSALGRVQRFSTTGTYQAQWGTSGTGSGSTEFNQPFAIACPPLGSGITNVFVGDMSGRVREYTQSGGYVSQPVGTYDFATNTSLGPLRANVQFGIAFDGRSSMYVKQEGHVWKFVPGFSNSGSVSDYQVGSHPNGDWDAGTGYRISGYTQGLLHTLNGDTVEQYAGSLSSIQAYMLYYIALAAEDFPARLLALADSEYFNLPDLDGRYSAPDSTSPKSGYPTWRMSVWRALCELLAATGNAATAFDDFVAFYKRDDAAVAFRIPDDVEPSPISLNSRSAPRNVAADNWNARMNPVYTAPLAGSTIGDSAGTVMYSAREDNNRVFNVGVNSLDYVTVDQGTFPELLLNPYPVGLPVSPFTNPSVEESTVRLGYFIPNGAAAFSRGTTGGFAYDGVGYAQLTFTTAPTLTGSFISNEADVVAGRRYDFRLRTRCTGASQNVTLFVDWRDRVGSNVGTAQSGVFAIGTGGWTELSFSTIPVAPPGAVLAYVQVRHHSTGRAWLNGESLYTDAYSIGPWGTPAPTDPIVEPGQYTVYDRNGVLVNPNDWVNYGASVRAGVGENPGQILLTLTGPGVNIPGTEAPYKIASVSNQATLSVIGQGLTTNLTRHVIGTGAAESAARTDVLVIDSPFIVNAGTAYTEASWSAYRYNPSQSISFEMRNDKVPGWASSSSGNGGTALMVNMMFRYKEAIYTIDEVSSGNGFTTINAHRHTPVETSGTSGTVRSLDWGFEPLWRGRTAGEFDAYWDGHPAQDFTLAPLRNPFNDGAAWIDA